METVIKENNTNIDENIKKEDNTYEKIEKIINQT